eukprot:XP_011677578.1 PREDICTED: uncharacterized protein LOC105444696 [Strongylocentrotus purpuratus]
MPSRHIPSPTESAAYMTPDPQPSLKKQPSSSLGRRLTSGARPTSVVASTPSKPPRGVKASTQRPVSAASYLSVTGDQDSGNKPQLPEVRLSYLIEISPWQP